MTFDVRFLLFLFIAFAATLAPANPNIASAKTPCPNDPGEAIKHARSRLESTKDQALSNGDRDAILCVIDAVDTINTKLDAIMRGETVLDKVISREGFVLDKPKTEEGM